MGLISRVSSRTYRLYKKNPKFSKNTKKMDGGGFTPGEQGDARVKGVNPICAKWIQSMRESNNLPLSHGPQKVSALNTYVGAFVKLAEDVVTHYTIDLKDPTSDIMVKGIIQKNNTKNKIIFDASMEDNFMDRYVSCIGFVQDHLEHGKCFNIVAMKLVKSGTQVISHMLSIDRQVKFWTNQAPGGATKNENMGEVKNENTNKGQSVLNQVANYIKELGSDSSWGCNKSEIYKNLSLTKTQIDTAITELVEEGAIFNTVDDEHFQAS